MCFDPGAKVAKRPPVLSVLCSSQSRQRENQTSAICHSLGSSQVGNGFLLFDPYQLSGLSLTSYLSLSLTVVEEN